MIIPIDWLKNYIDIDKSPSEIAKSFTSLGLMLDKPIKNNTLELEQRLNRADLLSILGCARDLAAFENLKLKHPKTYIKKGKQLDKKDQVKIGVKGKGVVNRFNTRVFKNITVKDSPKWLKDRLEAYGLPTVNNIVDITNFVMVELGQPMHAQDLAKFDRREIIIRQARKGEKITTLLGETIKLGPNNSILTQNDKPVCITGIVGGQKTSVTNSTTEIILDAGNYNQNVIRKSSRELKIQNETVLRADKFLHPESTQIALERATKLILDLAGGQYYENIDWYLKPTEPQTMPIRLSRIKQIGGTEFSMKKIKKILKALEYEIVEESNSKLILEIPYFRTDVTVEDNIVSDILRISNYENIPTSLIDSVPPKNITPEIYHFEDRLRDIMVNLGGHEHITEPLVPSSGKKSEVILENSLSPEKATLRTNILETLKPIVPNYFKHGKKETFIFEIGKSFHKTGKEFIFGNYKESRELGILYENPSLKPKQLASKINQTTTTILKSAGISSYSLEQNNNDVSVMIKNDLVGKLAHNSLYLNTEILLKHSKFVVNIVTSFPNQHTEDISLITEANKPFGDVYQFIKSYSKSIISVEKKEDRTDKSHGRTILLRLTFKQNSKVESIKKDLLKDLKSTFNIEIRK